MKLTSVSHCLISLRGAELRRLGLPWEIVWVGFDEHGTYRGHYPYIQNPTVRQEVIKSAHEKGQRLFPDRGA